MFFKKIIKINLWLALFFFLYPLFSILFSFILIGDGVVSLLNFFFPKEKIQTTNLKNQRISIVIPHYNRKDLIFSCLKSIYSSSEAEKIKKEVIVVDDASKNDSCKFLKKIFPEVKVIRNRKNKGFNYSSVRGIKEAKNELILLLNNDVVFSESFFLPLMKHFKNKGVFAVAPKIYAWDKKQFKRGMEIGYFKKGYFRFQNETNFTSQELVNKTCPTLFAVGAAMMFRKSYFEKLKGFDSIYRPQWWEDIDICYRAHKRQLKVLYEPEGIVYHKGGASIGKYKGALAKKNEFAFIFKNFTDIDIIISFFRYLPYVLYNGGKLFLLGFFKTLIIFPFIYLGRLREKRWAQKKDKEIFAEITFFFSKYLQSFSKVENQNAQTR